MGEARLVLVPAQVLHVLISGFQPAAVEGLPYVQISLPMHSLEASKIKRLSSTVSRRMARVEI